MNRKVIIVGAGFSGLTAAYFLRRTGFDVEIYEKSDRVGGLIRSVESQWGICETAANGILNSLHLEEMCRKIDLKIVPAQRESKRRFIYRDGLKTWPLGLLETVAMGARFASSSRKPKSGESLAQWGDRTLGKSATKYLLSPALQGIYAGDSEKLSASLILSRFFSRRRRSRPSVKGLVSFPRGMGELCEKLKSYLENAGVTFHFNSSFNFGSHSDDVKVIVTTGAQQAAKMLAEQFPQLGKRLSKIEMLSLVSVTVFFIEEPNLPQGFGILFPKGQNFRSLGVLLNNFIFPHRSQLRSETYILGGATDPQILSLSDNEILKIITEERARFSGSKTNPVGYRVQRWEKILPHYTVELENILEETKSDVKEVESKKIYLHGNYLGGIGLSQLLEQSARLVERLIPYE